MAHLIDKAAVVAEIEKRMNDLYDFLPDASKVENGTITISEACNTGKYTALESFRNYINTLEVKEVDFGIEICRYIGEHFNVYDDDNQTLQTKDKKSLVGRYDAEKIAKHFFELGLKAQKGEEV